MHTPAKKWFYLYHVLLLVYALISLLTWKTELPDGTILLNPEGFFLFPFVVLSALRLTLGYVLLCAHCLWIGGAALMMAISGHVLSGVVGLIVYGITIFLLFKWSKLYTPMGIFKTHL